jgi:branched-chain amino acid transport system ATP-binding protein
VSTNALTISDLSQNFGGVKAVAELSFSVGAGELFGVIGPNGAGKTTLLNCVSGLHHYSQGDITLGGTRLTGRTASQIANLGVARTFQAADFFPEFSVLDYLLLGRYRFCCRSLVRNALSTRGARRAERAERDRAADLLAEFDLAQYRDVEAGVLPYGTRKLLDVLRATLMEPVLLLLDEPTSGTTVADRESLRTAVARIRDLGVTTVIVDHDVRFISDTCDRALAMNFGRELGTGKPDELLARTDVRESYVGLE